MEGCEGREPAKRPQGCCVPGCEGHACFGFRLPGSLRAQKAKGYVWTCAAHRAEGERRRQAGIDRQMGKAG